ncbi:MAG: Gfo/Idh/MocA family oxidoreductase [Gemmataceae bacterium]|nr:Gfo/Idh/MocA family oxidoreductase [Gemmataceae bacterium]MDW8266791.1 Gfo/Idh/MocA family oxidoreductase [Gemmataceae bacterium]
MTSTRREFLATAGAVAVAAAASAKDANSRLRVALVGLGGRATAHIRCLLELARENVELAAVCDVDSDLLRSRVEEIEKKTGKKPAAYDDMRRVFDDKSIDAVSFSTPNHWHCLGTIWACQAGKDVYVEKPLSHNIHEGRVTVEVARKTGRLVQHGTQCRSSPNIRQAIEQLHKGVIGRVYMARGMAYKVRPSLGKIPTGQPPASLNLDRWCGPAPLNNYAVKLKAGQWHCLWDYGNGEIGNQGVHQMDIIRWGLKLDEHPSKVQSMGGLYVNKGDQQTPGVQVASFQYRNRDLLVDFAVRDWYTPCEGGIGDQYPFVDNRNAVGVIFFGTEGYLIIPDYSSYYTFLGPKREPGPSASDRSDPMVDLPHFRNFIAAVRSRKASDLTADVEEGHKSSVMCHLANIAYRLGRTLEFDPEKERFVNDAEADKHLSRVYREPYVLPARV